MQRKKVLFIDDDEDLHEIVKIILIEENIELISMMNVTTISSIINIKPDLILLDEWLSDKKGSDICTELKNNQETALIPVILISAVPRLLQIAQNCHANGYISKPFDVEFFKTVLRAF